MCLEDVRLGRKTGIAFTEVTATALTWTRVLPQNANRIALILSPGALTRMFFRFSEPSGTPQGGIQFGVSSTAFTIDIKTHGLLATYPVWVYPVDVDYNCYLIETILDVK